MVMPPALVTRQDHLRVCGADEIKLRVMPREVRITSACAEQTVRPFWTRCAPWDHLRVCGTCYADKHTNVRDHLRVCGADSPACDTIHDLRGSSPRVRSRPVAAHSRFAHAGITSACAEQTRIRSARCARSWDHLRVYGADSRVLISVIFFSGSPPRVRSRRRNKHGNTRPAGITSACAEQTRPGRWVGTGSPPRVRSRLTGYPSKGYSLGITSACAEQTVTLIAIHVSIRDHLRVCGADSLVAAGSGSVVGSPPRVRSRRQADPRVHGRQRITSACAEQTSFALGSLMSLWDHLRVCGADFKLSMVIRWSPGSPPRVRSRHIMALGTLYPWGITSACAEQTSGRAWAVRRAGDHLRVCGADIV